jgi:hypothetical protein
MWGGEGNGPCDHKASHPLHRRLRGHSPRQLSRCSLADRRLLIRYTAKVVGCGTVFKLTTAGKETVLYCFKGGTTDGAFPNLDFSQRVAAFRVRGCDPFGVGGFPLGLLTRGRCPRLRYASPAGMRRWNPATAGSKGPNLAFRRGAFPGSWRSRATELNRAYLIELGNLGSGEYGFLPPGDVMSSSGGSIGKMYTFRVLE